MLVEMAWVSSTFDDFTLSDARHRQSISNRSTKHEKGGKPPKKQCVNLWVDEYPPSSLADVAVHKKKIQEVQNWLNESSKLIKDRRILLLTGPPGSGKSTVIRLLAKELNLILREWTNSVHSKQEFFGNLANMDNFQRPQEREIPMNQSDRFKDFIFRSSKYRNICTNQTVSSSLILIEELPHVFTMNPLEFRAILRKYSASCTAPIVFLVSESNKSSLLKTLFPTELQDEILITNIVFNPINSSLLQSALMRILKLTDNTSSVFFDSSAMSKKEFVQVLSDRSEGDVRSAINTLQFAMMRDDVGVVSKKSKSRKAKSIAVDDVVGFKDSSLMLFRALGKILYCKRETGSTSGNTAKKLPQHLQEHERPRTLLENPEDVFERSASDPSTFSLFLHQNCPSFFDSVEHFSSALQYFGDADIISAVWDPSKQLDTYVSSLSMRGLMHNLNVSEGKRVNQTFRSLTRPSWYNYISTSTERLRRCQTLHKGSVLTSEELMTSYIPLVSKIFLCSTAEADRFVQDVGLMFPPSVLSASSRLNTSICDQENVARIHVAGEDDEEFFIEEVDD